MKRSLPVVVLSWCALLASAGCRGDAGARASGPELGRTSPDPLEQQVGVLVLSSREQAGRLELSLELVSRAEEALELDWAVEWLGRDGLPLPSSPLEWHRARLEEGGRARVNARAPLAGTSSWRLRVAAPDSVRAVRG